ncbi:MAG: Fic family protein [Ardenticatenaceae bacterium]|nr:Fic family protein [Ardenticatenaceae bacterium]
MIPSHHFDSHERAYLAELMQDFPALPVLGVDEALNFLSIRYKQLDIEQLAESLQLLEEDQFVSGMARLPKQIHGHLYKGILKNAGEYRQGDDKNGGIVFFGTNQKFRGFSPAEIDEGMAAACSLLSLADAEPIYHVVKFYQQFVLIHPFYDANGRIGRYVTSLYLHLHGYHLYWERLRQNNQWLKRLNACHSRFESHNYEEYVRRLVNHWSKFIISKEDVIPPDG